MPKKDAKKARVPFNCLIAPVTKEAITGIQNETKESQGEIVDRAVALLAYGEELATEPAKLATTEQLAGITRQVTPRPPPRPLKRPGVPEWKRTIRAKGDKTR